MAMRPVFFTLLLVSLLCACKQAPVASPTATPTPPPTEEDQARAAVSAWLSSQNQGDFAAYSALYAPRFRGIKRSGDAVARFDHDGWLADRKKMFGKKMTVTAEDLAVVPARGGPRVTFTQTWQSGTYRDVGRKRLELVRSGSSLLIAREEMLDSHPAERPAMPHVEDAPFAFVTAIGEDLWLLTGPGEGRMGEGEPSWLDRGEAKEPLKYAVGTRRFIARETLQANPNDPNRVWSGRRVALFDPSCQAQVTGSASLLSFSTAIYPGYPAQDSFRGGAMVVGFRLAPVAVAGADCIRLPKFARSAALPPVSVWKEFLPPPDLIFAASSKYRALPGWKNRFPEGTGEEKRTAFRDDVSGRSLLFLWNAGRQNANCDATGDDSFWAAFVLSARKDAPQLSLLADRDSVSLGALRVERVISESDGEPELVGWAGDGWEATDPVLIGRGAEGKWQVELRLAPLAQTGETCEVEGD